MPDEDKAYRVIKGRRWRVSDPGIPASLHPQLVKALMRARRSVAEAKRRDDGVSLRRARARVQAAKVALGERGPKWWETLSEHDLNQRAEATLFTLLDHRATDKSLCPSEVARATLSSDWRPLMPQIRALAHRQVAQGRLRILQKGREVGIEASGPIRIARGERFDDYFDPEWPS